jgi:AcrR family transcriptional regulator
MRRRRARNSDDKQQRRQSILDVARELVRERAYAGFTMTEVAERAGLAKGTLYLYFETREELALALLEQLLEEWFDDLDARLDESEGRWPAARLAELVHATLERHAPVVRLLAVLPSVLEHNIALPSATRFKRRLLEHLRDTGKRLERRLARLQPGEGARLLLHANALLVGLSQMAEPAAVVAEALADPQLRALRVDFRREFSAALGALFEGLRR